MSDHIIRGMAANNQVRFFAGTTRDIVETARSIHNTSPVATAALGRLLTAGALMGAQCKNESDVLTLQIQCNDKGKLDVAKALDLGVLSVIKDIGLKEPYVGQTQLVSGEIAEDLTYYFATSEQIPTSVALGVLMEKDNTVKQAGGFIIQLMPFASDELIDVLEKRLNEFSSITSLLDAGKTPLDIIKDVFEGYDVVVTDELPTEWHCNCSKERYYNAVLSLGKKEIASLLEEGEPIEVNCQFCNSHYKFSPDELKEMLLKAAAK